MSPDPERVGVIVIRVWREPPEGSLRARITWKVDVTSADEAVSRPAAGVEQILDAVRGWLDAMARESATGP
jgi:hypothetical protein